MVGANPTDAHPVFASQMKRRLREGAKLIVIEQRCDMEACNEWREFFLQEQNSPEAETGVPAETVRAAAGPNSGHVFWRRLPHLGTRLSPLHQRGEPRLGSALSQVHGIRLRVIDAIAAAWNDAAVLSFEVEPTIGAATYPIATFVHQTVVM